MRKTNSATVRAATALSPRVVNTAAETYRDEMYLHPNSRQGAFGTGHKHTCNIYICPVAGSPGRCVQHSTQRQCRWLRDKADVSCKLTCITHLVAVELSPAIVIAPLMVHVSTMCVCVCAPGAQAGCQTMLAQHAGQCSSCHLAALHSHAATRPPFHPASLGRRRSRSPRE